MPRIKKKVLAQADKAAEKAKKDFYKDSKKKKKKSPREYKSALGLPQTKWVEDPLGNQGVVFFDGFNYWLTVVPPKSKEKKKKGFEPEFKEIIRISLTPEQWEERNKRGEENEDNTTKT